MGNPTFYGLNAVRALFKQGGYPMDEFRTEICQSSQWVFMGEIPSTQIFDEGIPVDLGRLAIDDPYGEPKNVALCSLHGEFGLRFVERHVFWKNYMTGVDELPRTESASFILMEPYGSKEFLEIVGVHSVAIHDLARYGKPDPSLKERIVLRLFPKRYTFPVAGTEIGTA
ncbi:MAG: hypothetical protein P4L67_01145 [Candidatus Pacebacteria bacterium]|nr:hypothetical protein [Candidatus Paceibacterota bacterium]